VGDPKKGKSNDDDDDDKGIQNFLNRPERKSDDSAAESERIRQSEDKPPEPKASDEDKE
jgi:hypothetical protein